MKVSNKTLGILAALFFSTSSSVFAFPVNIVTGTPITEAVRGIGMKAGIDVAVNTDLKGTVSLNMKDATFESAMDALAAIGKFSYEIRNGVAVIGAVDDFRQAKMFKLNHLYAEPASEQVKLFLKSSDSNNVVFDKERNTVSVSGTSTQLERIGAYLKEADVAQEQIVINAAVVELSKSKVRNMGATFVSDLWTKDTLVSGYNGFVFGVTANHEETLGSGKVLARPNLITVDGREASLLMGDKVPVFTSTSSSSDVTGVASVSVEYKDVGVKLEVLPRVSDVDNEVITMVVKPTVSTISQWIESGNNKAPQVSERCVETTIRVKAGETVLIGGLLKDEELKSMRGIPFLSKIPVFGELFRSRSIDKRNTEVVIAITPILVKDFRGTPQLNEQKVKPSLKEQLEILRTERENGSKIGNNSLGLEKNNKNSYKNSIKKNLVIAEEDDENTYTVHDFDRFEASSEVN